jgi:hypothetical protein
MSDRPGPRWPLAVAWALIAASCALLLVRAPHLPDPLPVYRTLAGETVRWAPRSDLLVVRVALLGAAQLAAVTAVLLDRPPPADGPWTRLLGAGALAVGAKAVLESLGLAALGTSNADLASTATLWATFGVVAAVLARTAALWRGGMGPFPPTSPLARIGVGAAVAAWAALAMLPLLLDNPGSAP